MVASRSRSRRLSTLLVLGAIAGAAALGACSADQPAASPRPVATPRTSEDGGASATADVTTGDAAATATGTGEIEAVAAPPTTDEGTTTPAPTDPPTTTAAPPTTSVPPAPATTTAPLPPAKLVPVEPLAAPLVAVGTSGGAETARVQQRLLDLGFWLQSADGNYDLTTSQAVMAFQKYLGIETSSAVDANTAGLLSAMTLRAYGHADSGTLLEIDKTRQILMFVVDGRVKWVFNTSTGNGESYIEEDQNSPGTLVEGVSLTPDGFHRVNRERPEGWWEGDLGQIYRPKYFVGGVAVHGSNSVPNYPASHGCVRVTIQAMDYIWDKGLMPMTLPVWVHQLTRPA
jgi:hypothetical protein